jgi:CRISPR-associated protein Cas1
MMIKKVIEISQARTYLSVQYGQLVIRQKTEDNITAEGGCATQDRKIPCEDIGVLLIDHPGTTYTHSVFTELLGHGAAVVICGRDHHPTGMFLPIEANTVQTERYRHQINAKEPLKKQLWKQLIAAKIRHQAKVIGHDTHTGKTLLAMSKKVRSGDPDNVEAQASRKFWESFLGEVNFRRNADGPAPNNMLNYGYTAMRAAVARALCSAGLLPSLGIHHCNRYNAFCLADDVLEPFRGFVEGRVRDVWMGMGERPDKLDQQTKARLLELLQEPVSIAGFTGPLIVGLHRTAASLQRCFAGEQKEIELPEL